MELSVLRYLPVIIIIGLLFIFIWKQWGFFKGVLSDGTPMTDKDGKLILDKEGNPIILGSATRVIAFLFALCVMVCELYMTIKTEKLDYSHLIAFLVSIGVLLGYIKWIDLINAKKGNINTTND